MLCEYEWLYGGIQDDVEGVAAIPAFISKTVESKKKTVSLADPVQMGLSHAGNYCQDLKARFASRSPNSPILFHSATITFKYESDEDIMLWETDFNQLLIGEDLNVNVIQVFMM